MTYTWDSDNKLRSADIDANGTADVNFQYDALGRRVARTGTGGSVVFVQMDQQTIADYPVGGAATTPTFRYVYASYIDEPVVRKGPTSTSTVHFYHRNQQYSVTAMTTSTGSIAERYAYTAYGQPTILNASGTPLSPQTSTLNSRYSYTGREWDATLGLHHFRARWMSPSAGRFLGRDPIGYEDGTNLFEYVRSNPTNENDPSGLRCVGPFLSLGWGGANIGLAPGHSIVNWYFPKTSHWALFNHYGYKLISLSIWGGRLYMGTPVGSYVKETLTNDSIEVESQLELTALGGLSWYAQHMNVPARGSCFISCVVAKTASGEVCSARAICPITPDIRTDDISYWVFHQITAFNSVEMKSDHDLPNAYVDWEAIHAVAHGGIDWNLTPGGIEVKPVGTGQIFYKQKFNGGASWYCNCEN